MARTLAALREDVRKRADVEGADERHPDPDIDRHIHQGRVDRHNQMIEARGRAYFRKFPPQTITTIKDQTRYALPADFLRLISVRVGGTYGYTLVATTSEDEPMLRSPSGSYDPTHYELQDGYIEILPAPPAGKSIVLEYVATLAPLASDDAEDTTPWGFEEYPVVYAARQLAIKDEEWDLVHALDDELKHLRDRIATMTPKRDGFRAERVKDVRQTRSFQRFLRPRGR
jgi:hypothetical protein